MNEHTLTPGGDNARPAIVDLIERAYSAAREKDVVATVAWIMSAGWRFRDEDFDELLLARGVNLTDDDLGELRMFRERLIEERVAA